MASSINQNTPGHALPNFRNLGVVLRILLIVNGACLLLAVVRTPTWDAVPDDFMVQAVLVQPVLLLAVVVLYGLSPALARLPYGRGVLAVLAMSAAGGALGYLLASRMDGNGAFPDLLRFLVVSVVSSAVLLGYFDLRGRALSPALTEARLQALQARIRPHFLFNSINAVLSLIRSDPKRAEAALEDMAELFRVAMSDTRKLSPLAREVELCRQYLELEALRLGERLRVEWHTENMPGDALVPPMILQPLVENAVYHGIEPGSAPGAVTINIYKNRSEVHMAIKNPYHEGGREQPGNRIALANIRERLSLHFDAEARLDTRISGGAYQVHITLPYLTEAAA
jgi:two-component system sensor histidine kinase AlgZ